MFPLAYKGPARPSAVLHPKLHSNMFARTFILIAAAIIGVNAACDSGLPGYTHIVNPGETCWGIATQGGIDVARLESANPSLNCDLLVVGQRLCVPSN
ncbi:hypothetical protein EV421DRAFT_831742 [Armillaria borealis]|uniref:LysM domain-containing protein n=1 Tax=Armillaria borealis TaxID=47425 RepID=A0AA39JCK9_9AGAR|nr:hypothetical protein EV421DRAFT_831742 [Armillaria borealis]